ncbi:MAG: hypothetical protein U1C58_02945 [Flavobacteriaceae bacterium]|nr:hypothetical protein [Flavobacteriaceae bacterium]MDZ4147217.1 hypothetical protein [Flavobacteriaceae bacterium]
MKIQIHLLPALLALSLAGCESDTSGLSQEQDQSMLNLKLTEIVNLAESVICEDSSDWTFTGIGGKACGGPTGYIAYSTTINVENFLLMVEDFNAAEANFNKKWGIISDCSTPAQPIDIDCINGKAALIFP